MACTYMYEKVFLYVRGIEPKDIPVYGLFTVKSKNTLVVHVVPQNAVLKL